MKDSQMSFVLNYGMDTFKKFKTYKALPSIEFIRGTVFVPGFESNPFHEIDCLIL